MEELSLNTDRDSEGLIGSIRDDSAHKINLIMDKAEEEIKGLREAFDSDIEKLKKKSDDETVRNIEKEVSRIKNRALTEKNKLKLRNIEDFIKSMIDRAIRELRGTGRERYEEFLIGLISESLSRIKGKQAMINISEEDKGLVEGWFNENRMKRAEYEGDVTIQVDNGITQGGAIVFDQDKRLYYNGTIERVVYRKYDQIRKGIVSAISKSSQKS
ncbi:MAG: V-type ATP synthase subunit E family protein [Thermodesulfobacteriota bacterium]|nr:V-type ATP synthase subunit E family protein [Thermodesulfobacteriota bacterium]